MKRKLIRQLLPEIASFETNNNRFKTRLMQLIPELNRWREVAGFLQFKYQA